MTYITSQQQPKKPLWQGLTIWDGRWKLLLQNVDDGDNQSS